MNQQQDPSISAMHQPEELRSEEWQPWCQGKGIHVWQMISLQPSLATCLLSGNYCNRIAVCCTARFITTRHSISLSATIIRSWWNTCSNIRLRPAPAPDRLPADRPGKRQSFHGGCCGKTVDWNYMKSVRKEIPLLPLSDPATWKC